MRLALPSLLVTAVAGGACGSGPAKPVEEPTRAPTRVPIEEPEEEDGVSYTSDRGTMDIEVIKAGIAPHEADLTACYTSRIGARRWLGGKVTLHWDITKDAEVTAVRLAESDLGARDIEKCVLDVARTATFGKPRGNADAEFEVPLMFEKGRPAAQWDEDASLRAVGGQVAMLDECAVDADELKKLKAERAKQRPRKPARAKQPPKGKAAMPKDDDEPHLIAKPDDVAVTLYLGPGGKALSVGFASARSDLDDDWAACAEKTALAWRLPDPKGGIAKVAVKYRPQ